QRLRAPGFEALDVRVAQRRGLPDRARLLEQFVRRLTLALHFAASSERLGALVFDVAQPRLRGLQLTRELLHGVRCRLEPRAFLDQHGDLAREARPVDVREMPELLE